MTYSPSTFVKGDQTRLVDSKAAEVNARWDGFVPAEADAKVEATESASSLTAPDTTPAPSYLDVTSTDA